MDPIDESVETHSSQQLHHISQYYIDSAYSSGYNLTTPNVSSTNLNEVLTPQRNLNIIRDNLTDSSVNLTPVTQNINRISCFHITTPKSQDFLNTHNKKKDIQKIFNIKRSSEYLYDFDHFQSTPKKVKTNYSNSELSNDKSRNSTPLKSKRNYENLKFRHKLHSASDLDGYFDENVFSPKKLNKTSTKNNNRIPFVNLMSTTYDNCENKQSIIKQVDDNTDSVKKLLNCSNEQFNILLNSKEKSVNKLKIIDESIEFNDFYSDTSFNDFKKNNFININTCKPIKIDTDATKTPFRRFLSFTNDTEFKSPKCTSISTTSILNSAESNQKNSTSDDDFYLENSFRQYKKQYRVLNTVCSDRQRAKQRANAARSAELENSFREESDSKKSQSTDNIKDFGRIINLKSNADDGISIICDKDKTNTQSDCILLSAPKRKLSFEDENIAFTDKNKKNYNIEYQSNMQNTLLRTPKKIKIFPSNIVQNNNINFEKFEIIYPTIPATPRKSSIQLSPKKKHQEHKNTEQHNHYKKFYGGAIYLNIITKLESYPVVLDRIFDYLSSYDLLNLTMVTKTHRKIIKGNLKANRRLNQYLNDFQICKENYGVKNSDIDKEKKKSHTEIICNYNKKMPFAQNNTKLVRKKSVDILHSPPVSPSKRKFYENQKVVNTLSENQSISKCPRCAKASRIVNTSLEEAIYNNYTFTNKFPNSTNSTESFHKPSTAYFVPKNDETEVSSFLTQSQPIKPPVIRPKSKLIKSASVDTGLLQINMKNQHKMSFQPFGECMSKNCNFKFCLDCKCEYHPDIKCNQTISPSKEDIQNGILQLINSPYSKKARSSKMLRRKSLKRLCF